MTTIDIAKKYFLDIKEFEKYIRENDLPYKSTNLGYEVNDSYVEDFVNAFWEYNEQIEQEEKEKQRAISRMLITSGFTFDGYHIVKYSGYISGDDAISVDRGYTMFGTGIDVGQGINVKDKLMESLAIIRRNALKELKEAAYDLGCNAVIGVDFDYLTLDPQTGNLSGGTTLQPYIFGVTANGNAVIIEKNKD